VRSPQRRFTCRLSSLVSNRRERRIMLPWDCHPSNRNGSKRQPQHLPRCPWGRFSDRTDLGAERRFSEKLSAACHKSLVLRSTFKTTLRSHHAILRSANRLLAVLLTEPALASIPDDPAQVHPLSVGNPAPSSRRGRPMACCGSSARRVQQAHDRVVLSRRLVPVLQYATQRHASRRAQIACQWV